MTKICPKVNKFNPNERLPTDWIIPSSGQHFYRFGFSQYRNGCTDRPKLYHSLLVFIIPFVYNLRCLYSALTHPKSDDFHLLIGDWGHFIDMQFHMNLTIFLALSIAIFSQIIHYFEFFNGRGQPYMKIFNMMSGQITPHSIGLIEEKTLKAILKRTRICFKIYDSSRVPNIIAAIVISFPSFLIKDISLKTILFGCIHSVNFTLVIHYTLNVILCSINCNSFPPFLKDLESNVRTKSGFPAETYLSLTT